MEYLKIIAFTHKQTELKDLGKLVIPDNLLAITLESIKNQFNISEIFYLSTCNRIEFVFTTSQAIDSSFVAQLIAHLDLDLSADCIRSFSEQAGIYQGTQAMQHLLRVSCSLESLVVGEKEIFAQLRKAYQTCRQAGFTGDYLRLVMDHVVITAKLVYTSTRIAQKPVSVVSLAYRKLRELHIPTGARILIIGAGDTNRNISQYLRKHAEASFTIFNRTATKAQRLAQDLSGEALPLSALASYEKGFDVIITCTAATTPIITADLYHNLLQGETSRKIIVDLAVPNDTCPEVLSNYPVHFIEVSSLQEVAKKNMRERKRELIHAERIIEEQIQEFASILKRRQIELAMRSVPEQIKTIRQRAMDSIFAQDINTLDEGSREVLQKVVNYIEKKYISIPMVMAKEILERNC